MLYLVFWRIPLGPQCNKQIFFPIWFHIGKMVQTGERNHQSVCVIMAHFIISDLISRTPCSVYLHTTCIHYSPPLKLKSPLIIIRSDPTQCITVTVLMFSLNSRTTNIYLLQVTTSQLLRKGYSAPSCYFFVKI